MKIIAIHSINGTSHELPITDILFLSSEDDKIIIHTANASYYPPRTLKDFALLLHPHGFSPLEKSNVTNIKMIRKYDKISKAAFFDKNCKGKCVVVSRRNLKKIHDFL
ncbi:hypothetical protein GNQ08_29615 [Paenibacillus macerans]|uniref:HTH LytTR-type domain-containing protein n=1 Tax=Paenibacillus macerans TaxID=44252 RepID=A0A6N8F3H3_PAEMA|nr:hypothetical protein [Paenibacillus macerans]